jgi:hypothetical protein
VPREALVPFDRLSGWLERFETRHQGTQWSVSEGAMSATSLDGTAVSIEIPFESAALRTPADVVMHLGGPWRLGIVLVRRGGFAVAYVVGSAVVEAKTGRRHVQGKTKAGGWSQQRFANRRDNQARVAFEAAAGYVEQLLLPRLATLDLIASGGDRRAVETVFSEPTLRPLRTRPQRWLGGVPDPKRAVLEQAIATARSVTIHITDP